MNNDCVLAATGASDGTLWIPLGLALVIAGVVLLVWSRRRRHAVLAALVVIALWGVAISPIMSSPLAFAGGDPCQTPSPSGSVTVAPTQSTSATPTASQTVSPSATTTSQSPSPSTSTTVRQNASLAGVVWWDRNRNGVRDPGEAPLPGVVVTLSDGSSVTTRADGSYLAANLTPGTYAVSTSASGVPAELVTVTANAFLLSTPLPVTLQILASDGAILHSEDITPDQYTCSIDVGGLVLGTGQKVTLLDSSGIDQSAAEIAAGALVTSITPTTGTIVTTLSPAPVTLAASEARTGVDIGLDVDGNLTSLASCF